MPASVPYVAVIGGSVPSAEQYEAARKVGEALAAKGAVLVCGGRGGVMEAACRGAAEKGGITVGLLPGGDRAEANEWAGTWAIDGVELVRSPGEAVRRALTLAVECRRSSPST